MIWVLISSLGGLIIFIILYINLLIKNSNLMKDNVELYKNVDIKQKQLEIAANHPDTPADLAKRMRDGTL